MSEEVFSVYKSLSSIDLFGSKMLKAELQGPVAVADMVGLVWWSHWEESLSLVFQSHLDLTVVPGVHTPENVPLGYGRVWLEPRSFQQHLDGFVLREYPELKEAHKNHQVQLSGISLLSAPWGIQSLGYHCYFCSLPFRTLVFTHPLFSGLCLSPLVWKMYKYLRFCCSNWAIAAVAHTLG